ncbi:MAG: hypothetical protein ABL985_21255, partial [Casimicrobium sp.]
DPKGGIKLSSLLVADAIHYSSKDTRAERLRFRRMRRGGDPSNKTAFGGENEAEPQAFRPTT